MFAVIAAIFFIISIQNVSSSTNTQNSARNDYDNNMLKEILQRIDRIERKIDRLEDNNKNMSLIVETIVEQQMVITAEIFTVSQTLPFCCCQYQNSTDPPEIETTTPRPLRSLPTNCAEAMGESGSDGVYKINVSNSNIDPFEVYCVKKISNLIDEDIIQGAWLIFQRRQDNTTDFYQNWDMYKRGFGDLNGNFWIGLDKLYALTNSTKQELWIQLVDRHGEKAWAKYGRFAIGNEDEKYNLKTLGSYNGTAGDSLSLQKGYKWSTWDQDNDVWSDVNCAVDRKGAWWYASCGKSNLNGMYDNNEYLKGINWEKFRGFEHSLKYTHMAIRRMQCT